MKRILPFLCALLALLILALPVAAQTPAPTYTLHSQRLFGYGGFGGRARGTFRFSISGPLENVQSVTYQIDGQPMSTVNQSPYSLNFQTEAYPQGWHQFSALVATRDGKQVTTPALSLDFLSAEEQGSTLTGILLPLFGGIALIFLLMVGIQILVMRSNPSRMALGAPRHYGLKGGTICPRCGRPFAIHLWSINLLGSHLDRCDYCGKIGIFSRRSPTELESAEQAERMAAKTPESSIPGAVEETEEERLRKMMDESKYTK